VTDGATSMAAHGPDPFPVDRLRTVGDAMVSAADHAGVGVVLATLRVPEPEVLFASDAAVRILGVPLDELAPGRAMSATGLDRLPRWRDALDRLSRPSDQHGPQVFETTVLHPDGCRVPIEVTMSESDLDGRPVVVVFLGDISQERTTAERLQRAEARFSTLIETAPESIWITDAHEILYANHAAVRQFGYQSFEPIRGRSPLLFIHPDDVSLVQRRLRLLLESGEAVPPREYRVLRADGSVMQLEVNAIPGDYDGRQVIYCFGRDITERQQIEGQLLQADRLGVLGLLAGGMAHAINNPLTYVLLNIDHLLQALPQLPTNRALKSEALARLREAHHGAERVASVVRRMRAFSRSSERDAGPVDLREVLESAITTVGNEIRHRGRLLTSYEPVPPVYASLARLEQVFLNLLVCAAQSLPEGEEKGEVRVVLRPTAQGRVVAEVSDNGPGLDAQVVQRIYDPLAHRDTLSDRMALGLSLCHSIVTSIGGSFYIESRGGPGTTFRVELPGEVPVEESAFGDAAPSRSLDSEPPPVPLPRARVMVVDDDQAVADGLRLMLEDEHDVRSVSSGREALRLLLRGDQYDVVFCDLMMPELSGMDLYEALRLNAPGREGRLVFMTGGAFTPAAVRFLTLVPNPRIEKPFDLESVRRLLRRAVRRGKRGQ
jgi:two-component system cell cycle sensor histidine kinase/response regulator CckA